MYIQMYLSIIESILGKYLTKVQQQLKENE